MKATPTKEGTDLGRRRHYHLPQHKERDSWESWVGEGRWRFRRRLEWGFALFVGVALVGLIVWQLS